MVTNIGEDIGEDIDKGYKGYKGYRQQLYKDLLLFLEKEMEPQ